MAPRVRPQLLQTGTVTRSTRGMVTFALVALAAALRVFTHFRFEGAVPVAPATLIEFLTSRQWPWVDPPLPDLILVLSQVLEWQLLFLLGLELVATAIVVVLLMRLGERWLDFDAAVIGAGFWAVAAPAVSVFQVPGTEGWQAALAILVASAMLRAARQRDPKQGLRIGLLAGLLTLFSGGGMLWAIAAMLWLPLTSSRFRGWGGGKTALLIALGWLLIVVPVMTRNGIVSGGDPKFPLSGDLVRLHAATDAATVAAPVIAAVNHRDVARPMSVVYADSVLQANGFSVNAIEWARSADLLTLSLKGMGTNGTTGWRRLFASLGGWSPAVDARVVALPWVVVVLLAWCGVVALLPASRQLFPLLLGGAAPLLQGMLFGVDSGTILAASPFVCLYAGYGAWRIWTGRRWALTWAVVPVVLGVAFLLHVAVRDWV